MLESVWSMNSDLKSMTFKGFFTPLWLVPASATSLLLSTCSLALARALGASCQSTGCAISSRVILVWDVLILKGFCFCLVNMIFSDRSDFTFCAKLPSYEELHPPYVLSWMQVCAS